MMFRILVILLAFRIDFIVCTSHDSLLTYATTCDAVSGSCFKAYSTEMSHVDAWYECHRLGLHLAMPRTQQELDFIDTNITGNQNHKGFWIGLTDYHVEGEWMWMDGELLDTHLSVWEPGEPLDGYGNDEDCVEVTTEGWNNAMCDQQKPYLCQEYSPTCTSTSTYRLDSYCYRIITGEYVYAAYCTGIGGTLAMPKDTTINDYLYLINYEDKDMWIGLTGNGQNFIWIDQTILTTEQAKFYSLPPDPGVTNGIFMTSGGYWDGIENDYTYTASYACQVPAIDCGDYTFSNGVTLTGETILGTNRSYECVTGYLPVTSFTVCEESTSTQDGYWEPTPQCVMDCGNYTFSNGVTLTGKTILGTNRSYECVTGYLPVSSYTECVVSPGISGGYWEPTPQCLIDCGTYYIDYGSTISGNTSEGANQTYTCYTGYTPISDYTVCLACGCWDPKPACLIDCGSYSVGNGSAISGNTTEGANRTYTCNEGYTANNTHSVCQSSGTWDPEPACISDTNESLICFCANNLTYTNLTAEEQAEYYIRELSVLKKSLSSWRRQLTSADDDRTSAISIGVIGVVSLSVIGLVILIPDVSKLFSFSKVLYTGVTMPKS